MGLISFLFLSFFLSLSISLSLSLPVEGDGIEDHKSHDPCVALHLISFRRLMMTIAPIKSTRRLFSLPLEARSRGFCYSPG